MFVQKEHFGPKYHLREINGQNYIFCQKFAVSAVGKYNSFMSRMCEKILCVCIHVAAERTS